MALTRLEERAMEQSADLWRSLCQIVGNGPSRNSDLSELMFHIHGIQRAIGAQSLARTKGSDFRLLGEERQEKG